MSISINNYRMFQQLLTNPLSPSESTASSNAIFNASINALYGRKINNIARNELTSYLQSFSAQAGSLKTSSNLLNVSNKDSAFSTRTATVGNKEVIAATAKTGAEIKNYSIKVDSVAKKQVNKGESKEAAAINTSGSGTKTFTIEAAGKKTNISIEVKSYYTNRDVMRLASDAINKSGAGVNSRIIEDGSGKISFEIAGNKTGASNKFSVSDKEGTLAADLNVIQATQESSNSKFKIDDKEMSSETNEIKIDNDRVSIVLRSVGETTINVSQDNKKVTDAAETLASSYNNTMDYLKQNNISSGTAKLTKELENVVRFKQSSLESIGFKTGSDGKLSVDSKKFESSLKESPDRVKNVLSGADGFANKLDKIATQAISKPIVNFMDLTKKEKDQKQADSKEIVRQLSLNNISQQGILFDSLT